MTNPITTVKALASGTLVEVDATGRATLLRCPWLVRVPSGNPEPDFPEDCYREVECGATTTAFHEGWQCEAGHQFGGIEYELGPYGPEWQREQAERG